MISIITVSNRPHLIDQCIAQVTKQDIDGEIEHIIILDGIEQKEDLNFSPIASIIYAPAQPERYIFEKVGVLRNLGIEKSHGDYVALLDDDNKWEKNHLSTLFHLLQENPQLEAAHSWRTLWNDDNTPHLVDGLYPWVLGGDKDRQKMLFNIQCHCGILAIGSNIVRDQYGFEYNDEVFSCVDTGEWLLARHILNIVRFKEHFSYTEILYGFCDDYLFGLDLLKNDVKVKTTEEPTLRYYLGGNSQNYAQQ